MAKKAVTGGPGRTVSARSVSPHLSRLLSRLFRAFQKLGPGIVTGAADDDPSGIATYSQVGAQFGFTMLWTMLLTYPLMAGIQEISAWIGSNRCWHSGQHPPPLLTNDSLSVSRAFADRQCDQSGRRYRSDGKRSANARGQH